MNFKFTSWPYWVKGGVIGGMFGVLVNLIKLVLFFSCASSSEDSFGLCNLIFVIPFGFIVDKFLPFELMHSLPQFSKLAVLVIFELVVLCIIFSICGWLYGKLKAKKLQANSYKP